MLVVSGCLAVELGCLPVAVRCLPVAVSCVPDEETALAVGVRVVLEEIPGGGGGVGPVLRVFGGLMPGCQGVLSCALPEVSSRSPACLSACFCSLLLAFSEAYRMSRWRCNVCGWTPTCYNMPPRFLGPPPVRTFWKCPIGEGRVGGSCR